MPRVPVHNIGAVGLINDLESHIIPPEAWTGARNVRFRDNKLERFLGHQQVFGTPTVAPYWAMMVPDGGSIFWMYANLTKMYTYLGGVHTNITRQSAMVDVDYATDADLLWNGGVFQGIPVVTNGVDVPQAWTPVSASQKLVDLANWPSTLRCKILKPFKNFLIAMNLTDNGTEFPYRVRWSHSADPGTVPNSWDPSDPTKDTGETDLSDVLAGEIRDGLPLGDIFVIYKENSVWGMQFVGGAFIFRFFQLPSEEGILATDCVSLIPKTGGHFLATTDDVVRFDGRGMTSLLDRRMRRGLANLIDPDAFNRSFTVANPAQREMWFCFPESGATWPTLALVWNYVEDTITFRELKDISYIAQGIIPDSSGASLTTWDSDTGAWDADTSPWNTATFSNKARQLLACDPVNTKLYQVDQGDLFDTKNFTAYVEREGLAIVGQDRFRNPVVDFTNRKFVNRIWIQASGESFFVRVGAQEDINGVVVWGNAKLFTPGTDKYLDFTVDGRLIAVRFESTGDQHWVINQYDLQVELLGEL